MEGRRIPQSFPRPVRRTRAGMTLIEVLVSIALLGILAVMVTPVFSGAFLQVVLSGDRADTDHDIASAIESAIAGQKNTSVSGGSESINIPGIGAVLVHRLLESGTSKTGGITFPFYTEMTPTPIPTPTLTPTPEATPTPAPTATPIPTPTPGATPLTILQSITVDVSHWKTDNRFANLVIAESGTPENLPTDLQVRYKSGNNKFTDWMVYAPYGSTNISNVPNNAILTIEMRLARDVSVIVTLAVPTAPTASYNTGIAVTQGVTVANFTWKKGAVPANYKLEYFWVTEANPMVNDAAAWLDLPLNAADVHLNTHGASFVVVRYQPTATALASFPSTNLDLNAGD